MTMFGSLILFFFRSVYHDYYRSNNYRRCGLSHNVYSDPITKYEGKPRYGFVMNFAGDSEHSDNIIPRAYCSQYKGDYSIELYNCRYVMSQNKLLFTIPNIFTQSEKHSH